MSAISLSCCCHVPCYGCIRKPWVSPIMLYNNNAIAHNHHTHNFINVFLSSYTSTSLHLQYRYTVDEFVQKQLDQQQLGVLALRNIMLSLVNFLRFEGDRLAMMSLVGLPSCSSSVTHVARP